MLQKLASHNDDIRRLLARGYALACDSNYLVVRDIPYLDDKLALQSGAFVTKLTFPDATERVAQEDHTIHFAGAVPYGLDGKPIPNLGGGPATLALSEASRDVVVQRNFSNKPKVEQKFADFFEKVESYTTIISGPAIERFNANPFTFRQVEEAAADSVFKFHDTLTSRAEITDLAAKFKEDDVAIIGLGGTGAYILDFMVRTPVRSIRGFDLDEYQVHNAFRSPGRLRSEELGKPKAVVYQDRYEKFRTGLSLRRQRIDATSVDEVKGVTFAFVCVDKGEARAGIFELLLSQQIPFIDVGMGLKRKNGSLTGMMRTTHYSRDFGPQMRDKNMAPLADGAENLYRANVQIAELNALNAALAVTRFKQLRGFYAEDVRNDHLLLDVRDLQTVGRAEHEV